MTPPAEITDFAGAPAFAAPDEAGFAAGAPEPAAEADDAGAAGWAGRGALPPHEASEPAAASVMAAVAAKRGRTAAC
jgi:hypothetical protein